MVFLYLATLAGTLTLGLVYYLNFKYGFSLAPEITDLSLHEVRERDYFFIAAFALWGALAGMGLAWAWAVLAGVSRSPRAHGVTAPVLLLALLPLVLNWPWADRSGDYAARDWAYDLLMSVEPYGVLFTNGDNDTFPLWYLQEVEGIRKDVTVIVGQYLFTTWYPKQLEELTTPERQRPYDPTGAGAAAAELYGTEAPAPTASITVLTPEEMDRIGGVRLDRDVTIPIQSVALTYGPGMVLTRGHQLALSVIHDASPERPIYFASQAGLMRELGLDRWGVRQGLVVKLDVRDLDEAQPGHLVQSAPELGSVWFDLPRSLALFNDVYRYRGIRDRRIWQDRSTLNIPWSFYAMSLQMADVARTAGEDTELVQTLQDAALNFQVVAQGGARGIPAS